MSLSSKYYIEVLSYKRAQTYVIKHHYLHRSAPCSYAFGLFQATKLMGCVLYGTPPSAPLRSGICGPEEQKNVIELTRLYIDDSVPKNGESYLIGNTIKYVNKEILVSFAEIDQGHVGTVYQATNWIYTGLSAKRSNWVVEGVDRHSITIADRYTSKQLREIYGDKFKLVPRPRKHRYIYFNCDRRRKRILLAKLRYPILPYPKLHE